MDCEHIEVLLSAYLDEELTLEEKALVEKHLAFCPECMTICNELKEMSFLMHDQLLMWQAPPEMEATVWQQIEVGREQRQLRRIRKASVLGGALLMATLVTVLLSPLGIALLSMVRLFARLTRNFLPLLWHVLGSQSLLTAGIVGAGVVITVFSLLTMKKIMQTFAPGQ